MLTYYDNSEIYSKKHFYHQFLKKDKNLLPEKSFLNDTIYTS